MTIDKSFTARQRIEQLENAYNDLVPMVERALKIAKETQESRATEEADLKEEIADLGEKLDHEVELRETGISNLSDLIHKANMYLHPWWWQFWK